MSVSQFNKHTSFNFGCTSVHFRERMLSMIKTNGECVSNICDNDESKYRRMYINFCKKNDSHLRRLKLKNDMKFLIDESRDEFDYVF
jgi:hypothetical protein